AVTCGVPSVGCCGNAVNDALILGSDGDVVSVDPRTLGTTALKLMLRARGHGFGTPNPCEARGSICAELREAAAATHRFGVPNPWHPSPGQHSTPRRA